MSAYSGNRCGRKSKGDEKLLIDLEWPYFAAVVLCEEYNVVITTEPASGPFLVNQEIEFTCYVDPAPPEPVTFSWHAVKEANGATTLRSQSSVNTTSYTPRYSDLHISWFFDSVRCSPMEHKLVLEESVLSFMVLSYSSS